MRWRSRSRTATAPRERFAGEAAPQLLESLMRIRDTANAAADHAREAIERIVPDAGGAIEAAGKEALEKSLAAIAEAQTTAAASATEASDKLNEQMRAIADASGHIEARLADTERRRRLRAARVAADRIAQFGGDRRRQDLADRSAGQRRGRPISRAIAACSRRRAVQLLDAGETARDRAGSTRTTTTFREQVNRYIHDFEAMLRAVLAQRDGAPLGVTLLSSDMGKLYVALAQAIERLRA